MPRTIRALLATAALLSAAWWLYEGGWEPVISSILAVAGLLASGAAVNRRRSRPVRSVSLESVVPRPWLRRPGWVVVHCGVLRHSWSAC